jgi:hypothetical protein
MAGTELRIEIEIDEGSKTLTLISEGYLGMHRDETLILGLGDRSAVLSHAEMKNLYNSLKVMANHMGWYPK